MYEFFEGAVSELTPAYAVINCGGVGYFLNISLQTYSEIEKSDRTRLYSHYIVREDAQILYGFATKLEREHFRLLISVSGVGGGTARMILSTYKPDELANIICDENATLLKNVKGLGMKTAQKIIVELKDKIVGDGRDSSAMFNKGRGGFNSEIYDEAIAALTMLGFAKNSSDKVIKLMIKDNPDSTVEQIIRMSLKKL